MENYENISQIDWARLAAYIDGEGCISFKPRVKQRTGTRVFTLVIEIANTDMRIPLWCKKHFGGSIQVQERYLGKDGIRRRSVAYWNVGAALAEKVLCHCLPYFIAKREQAEIGLAFRETYKISTSGRAGAKMYPEVFERRLRIVKELKELRKNPPIESLPIAVGE